jgi:23S rRNA pseudouridine1911/1915/1917 synthase
MAKPRSRKFHVDERTPNKTPLKVVLDFWLKSIHGGNPKSLVQNHHISINGLIVRDVLTPLNRGDVVHYYENPRTPLPTIDDIEIVHLDADVVVVNKPALMTTMPHEEEKHWNKGRKRYEATLLDLLPEIVTSLDIRPGRGIKKSTQVFPVHRLDRDTSGLMVFARSQAVERQFTELFSSHAIHRIYQAIVSGNPGARTIQTMMIRDRGDGLRGSSADSLKAALANSIPKPITKKSEGEIAITHIEVVEELGDFSCIQCQLETGRTHQIRIHLSEIGHMICGEPLYYKKRDSGTWKDMSDAPRLALHACEIGFEHPTTGESYHFKSKPPQDLSQFQSRLRREKRAADQPAKPAPASSEEEA